MTSLEATLAEATGWNIAWQSDGGSNGTLMWASFRDFTGFITCTCGYTIALEPGERFNEHDPRLCSHGRESMAWRT